MGPSIVQATSTVPPSTFGFGSRLVKDTVEGTFAGRQQQQWPPDGLKVTIHLALDRLKA